MEIWAIALVAILVTIAVWYLSKELLRLYRKESKKIEKETSPEVEAINNTVKNLSYVIAELEGDSNKASVLLADAQIYTQTLVNLIQGIALKGEAMADEIEQLQGALEAIASMDPLQVAKVAGQVKDPHIRTLMLCRVKNSDYWLDISRVVATQLGTLQQWEKGYRTFTGNLLSEVSKAKSQLAASTAALELTGVSRPLLETQANLVKAQKYLQLQRKPGIGQVAKELPMINTHLLQ